MSALGDTFRAKRESQGLTLLDVAERTHIRWDYLAAIEAENWKAIGPPVYVRGFMRSYARCLGLDGDAAVAQFAGKTPSAPARSVAGVPPRTIAHRPEPLVLEREGKPRAGLSLGAIAGLCVALALVIFVGYQYAQYSRGGALAVHRATPAHEASSAPLERTDRSVPAGRMAEARPATKPADRASGFAVRLRDSSWVRVVVDGKVAMEGIYPTGTERTFVGRSATVRVGNAGGVDIAVDGKDLGPMGGLGDVAERSFQL
jgi:cytoskeleton protein RodZ